MSIIIEKTSGFVETVKDWSAKILGVSLIPTIGLFAYLLYGLFSGQLAAAARNHNAQIHAIGVIHQLSYWLNISLVISLISAVFLFFEVQAFGIILLAVAGFLQFGLPYVIDFTGGSRLIAGTASKTLFEELKLVAMIVGAPGIMLVGREIVLRIVDTRSRQDLSSVTYGKEVAEQSERPHQALIGAFAACWQLPFCRDGIRVKCPIFHARTKCWQERVGCMCEENIILLAMGASTTKGQDMTAAAPAKAGAGGFIPIGDLLNETADKARANIPMRRGPRGVMLPANPHISEWAKRERCRNCVIYNEHQRQKYAFLSGPVTVLVPILVFWQYQNLLTLLSGIFSGIDGFLTHISFNGQSVGTQIGSQLAGNVPIETILIICLSLVLMTWAQRLLEYCVLKLKI